MKNVYVDDWSTLEKVCLASAVLCHGTQRWGTVCKLLKPRFARLHPDDWFTPETCAVQYGLLVKKYVNPQTTTVKPVTQIIAHLKDVCRRECVPAQKRQEKFNELMRRYEEVKSNNISPELLEKYYREAKQMDDERKERYKQYQEQMDQRKKLKSAMEHGGTPLKSEKDVDKKEPNPSIAATSSFINVLKIPSICITRQKLIDPEAGVRANKTPLVKPIPGDSTKLEKESDIQRIERERNEIKVRREREIKVEELPEGTVLDNYSGEGIAITRLDNCIDVQTLKRNTTETEATPLRTYRNYTVSTITADGKHRRPDVGIKQEESPSLEDAEKPNDEVPEVFKQDIVTEDSICDNTDSATSDSVVNSDSLKVEFANAALAPEVSALFENESDETNFTPSVHSQMTLEEVENSLTDTYEDNYSDANSAKIVIYDESSDGSSAAVVKFEQISHENNTGATTTSTILDDGGDDITMFDVPIGTLNRDTDSNTLVDNITDSNVAVTKETTLDVNESSSVVLSDEPADTIDAVTVDKPNQNVDENALTFDCNVNETENVAKYFETDDVASEQHGRQKAVIADTPDHSNRTVELAVAAIFADQDNTKSVAPDKLVKENTAVATYDKNLKDNRSSVISDINDERNISISSCVLNAVKDNASSIKEFNRIIDKDQLLSDNNTDNEDTEENGNPATAITSDEHVELAVCRDEITETADTSHKNVDENTILESDTAVNGVDTTHGTAKDGREEVMKTDLPNSEDNKDDISKIEEKYKGRVGKNVEMKKQNRPVENRRSYLEIFKQIDEEEEDDDYCGNVKDSAINIDMSNPTLIEDVIGYSESAPQTTMTNAETQLLADTSGNKTTIKVEENETVEAAGVVASKSSEGLRKPDTKVGKEIKLSRHLEESVKVKKEPADVSDVKTGVKRSLPGRFGGRSAKKRKDSISENLTKNKKDDEGKKAESSETTPNKNRQRASKLLLLAYNTLSTHKYAPTFRKPVTEDQAPGYSKRIRHPMDLSTIKKKIDSGEITDMIEFQDHVYLMLNNAKVYNDVGSTVYNMALQMEDAIRTHLQMMEATGCCPELGRLRDSPKPNILYNNEKGAEKDSVIASKSNAETPTTAEPTRKRTRTSTSTSNASESKTKNTPPINLRSRIKQK